MARGKRDPLRILGEHFISVAHTETPKTWLSISAREPDASTGALTLLDFENPEDIIANRLALEVLTTGIVYATNLIPIPILGGALSGLFENTVESRGNRQRLWESRLIAMMEAYPNSPWNRELDQLYVQQMNPLLPTRQETHQFIEMRKALLRVNRGFPQTTSTARM